MECSICVSPCGEKEKFHCIGCKFDCCITCMKTYLLSQTNDPNCMKCRNAIPYDQFISLFDMKWRLGLFKTHKEKVLWEKEQSLLPISVQKLAKKRVLTTLKSEYKVLAEKMRELDIEMYELKIFIDGNNIKESKIQKFQYIHKCIDKNCNGYLNKDFNCDLCEKHVCNKCFIEKEEHHECDPGLVETCKLIKSEAKPCPNCTEYISKINGCDQMFCIKCGTAFSWNTGNIETGIIHNPHAHTFFQNNPDALNNYLAQNNQNNACRQPIPNYHEINRIRNKITFPATLKKYEDFYRYTAEFRHYSREKYIEYINNNNDENQDIRFKLLNKEIDEKKFKSTLHQRNKKRNFKKYVYEIIIPTTEIFENYLWTVFDIIKNKKIEEIDDELNKIFDILSELIDSSNKTIEKIYLEHDYTPKIIFQKNFQISNI